MNIPETLNFKISLLFLNNLQVLRAEILLQQNLHFTSS